MSCPYFKEGYFGICVAPDAIHVPSIDEMERLCFRSWYEICPNIVSPRHVSLESWRSGANLSTQGSNG